MDEFHAASAAHHASTAANDQHSEAAFNTLFERLALWNAFSLRDGARSHSWKRQLSKQNDTGLLTAYLGPARNMRALASEDPVDVAKGLDLARQALSARSAGMPPEQAALDLESTDWPSLGMEPGSLSADDKEHGPESPEARVKLFRTRLATLRSTAAALKRQDKAARACAWHDGIAGERATELVAKVIDGDPLHAASFRTLESIASNAGKLWAAMEGQEALGLFSIRAAGHLGLAMSGRDLPQRAKAAMKERFGLTEGGWRLLGKLASNSPSEDQPGGSAAPASKSWIDEWDRIDLDQSSDQMIRLLESHNALYEMPSSAADRRVQELRQQEWFRAAEAKRVSEKLASMDLFCSILSACAEKGVAPSLAEEILASGRLRGMMPDVFGEPKPDPAASAEDAAAERAAWAAKSPRLIAGFVGRAARDGLAKALDDLSLVKDWVGQAEWGMWRDLPESPSWGDAMARQRQWHALVQQRERGEACELKWDSLVGEMSSDRGAYTAHALTDGGMLWDEGKALRHCVSSYADRCVEGRSRIFSIRKDGQRLGTLELGGKGADWSVVQFRGMCNGKILDEEADALAGQVAKEYGARFAQSLSAANESLDKDIVEKWRKSKQAGAPGLPVLGVPAAAAP